MIDIVNHIGFLGDFEIRVGKSLDTMRVAAQRQPNMMLDIGIRHMSGWRTQTSSGNQSLPYNSNSGALEYVCNVGTGTTPVTAGDTALAQQLAESDGRSYDGGRTYKTADGTWVVEQRYLYTFPIGRATGILTELGLSQGKSNSTGAQNWFLTRALIKDTAGNPTQVTVLPDELLQVAYTIRAYLDKGEDIITTVQDGATTITVTSRPSYRTLSTSSPNMLFNSTGSITAMGNPGADGGQWYHGPNSEIGASTTAPVSGTGGATWGSQVQTAMALHATLNRKDWTCTIPATLGAAQIGAWQGGGEGPAYTQMGFVPRIQKTADESIVVTFQTTWGRYNGVIEP